MGSMEWTVIGTGIALLVVMTGLFAWMRSDTEKLGARLERRMEQLNEQTNQRMDQQSEQTNQRLDLLSEQHQQLAAQTERHTEHLERLDRRMEHIEDQMRHLGERTAKVEGLLEGLRESIVGQRAA